MNSRRKNQQTSLFRNIVDQSSLRTTAYRYVLQRCSKDSKAFVQSLSLHSSLKVHRGCVNTVAWDEDGRYILSGSDDQTVAITNPFTGQKLVQHVTGHRANIFSAKFLQTGVVSCSGDGTVLYTNIAAPTTNPDELHLFNCHNNTTYEVLTIPTEPCSFLSCGEDGTVRFFDLRQLSRCQKSNCRDNVMIQSPTAVTAMCLSPALGHHVAVGSADSMIRVYDRRCLRTTISKGYSTPVKCFTIPSAEQRPFRVTSVCYNGAGDELLVNYSSDHLYLFDATAQGLDIAKSFAAPFRGRDDPGDGGDGDAAMDMESTATGGVPTASTSRTRRRGGSSSDSGWLRPRRLRLRGDWSDTGPDARPEGDTSTASAAGQARPILQGPIMNQMTDMLSRMLADPRTRANLNSLNRLGRQAAGSTLGEQSEGDAMPEEESGRSEEGGPREHANSSQEGELIKTTPKDINEETQEGHDGEAEDMAVDPTNCDYLLQKFMGHRNARTMIKEASFWGDDYIMSGSDCGHVFTWDKKTGQLVMLMEADQHVVNCIQPHPTMPYLATSGIDYDVKIWAPKLDDDLDAGPVTRFDEVHAKKLMERNAVMLEETKDTITVPVSVMIRMLTCIHTFRNRRTLNDFARINR